MTTFDLHDWHITGPEPGQSWGDYLGLELDQDDDSVFQFYPDSPALSHITLKLRGQGDGRWLACFHPDLIQRAWEGGMVTVMCPATSPHTDRAAAARSRFDAGEFVNPEFMVVSYPVKGDQE